MENTHILINTLETIIDQLVYLLPKLIFALVIWYIGRYLIGLGVAFIRNIDPKKTKMKDHAVVMLAGLVELAGRVILILIILDFLGIGRTIIAAVTQGVTFAFAIALGISFGKALEPEAQNIMSSLRKLLKD